METNAAVVQETTVQQAGPCFKNTALARRPTETTRKTGGVINSPICSRSICLLEEPTQRVQSIPTLIPNHAGRNSRAASSCAASRVASHCRNAASKLASCQEEAASRVALCCGEAVGRVGSHLISHCISHIQCQTFSALG